MKKIGIVTFHASHNCGSMLQAYALQTFIKKTFGLESEIVDYSNLNQRRIYSILYKPKKIKHFFRNILNLFFYKLLKKHRDDYRNFSAKNFCLTAKSYSVPEEISNEKFNYTHVIAGSDQVWNVCAEDCDDVYFLSGMKNCVKIAYAVSLGATDISKQPRNDIYKSYINDFDFISVREKNAQKWIGKLYKKNQVDICVDPTLLFSKKEWEPLVGPREIEGKYIFWYAMTYKKDMRDIVLRISKETGLPVYVIDAKEWSRRSLYLHGIKVVKNGGPHSFLSLIKNAELVLTSSFHGSVFSAIFEKNFWYMNLRDEVTEDDRALFLLQQLGLEERYLMKNQILKRDLSEPVDYTEFSKIDSAKKYSAEFLKKSLEI